MRIGITGPNGFVGRELTAVLPAAGHRPVGLVRRPQALAGTACETRPIESIGPATDWTSRLDGLDVVVHLAARVHVMRDTAADPLAAFRAVNTAGTLRLAQAAATAGIKRFVFVSSIKVNGEETPFSPVDGKQPFKASDPAAPQGAYSLSKWEAEQGLAEIATRTGLEVAIVRPPLVYGRGAGGNFARLAGLVRRGVPLPLASVRNRRSLVAVETLADLLIRLAAHEAAAGGTFLVSDGEDLSTPDLIRRMGRAIGKPARPFPAPMAALRLVGGLMGRSGEIRRLTGSLQVDMAETRARLDWTPPVSVDAALERALAP